MTDDRRIGVVVSEADEASVRIGDALLDERAFETRVDDARPAPEGGGEYHVAGEFEVRTFEALHLHLEGVAAAFSDPDVVAFVSRHSGETGPLLTAHFTGNFGPAEFGGEAGALAAAAPNAQAAVVGAFEAHAPEGYEVGAECTHHGPSEVGRPSLFVEVGSAEPQWRDPEAARAAARAVLALEGVDPGRERTVVGFGGGHYVPRFLRILRETPWSVGHVGADWALEAMGDPREARGVIRQAFEESGAERAVIDGDRPELAAAIDDLGYEVVSETWLRAVGDRPLALVESVEDRLGPVEDGVRPGDHVVAPGEFVVVDLPDELVAEAQGIDPGAVRTTVERHAVAFDTTDGASRVDGAGRAALPDPDAYDRLVDGLAGVLREKYGSVRRGDDAVVATERAFDPDLAREAGVEEGPAFGRLSNGEPVTVDGRTVAPGDVHRERTRRFPV
jgi:D-aminoacyl-tRNA deacylase